MDAGFVENGYLPATEVRDALKTEVFHNPDDTARKNFYKSETILTPELEKAIKSTVLISEGPQSPGGSGVIVVFEDKRYLVTATHVIGKLLAGDIGESVMKFHYRDKAGQLQEGSLIQGQQLYDSTTARERGLQAADCAIFPFDGDSDGVELSDLDVSYDAGQNSAAVGFPGKFHTDWKESVRPLLSVGKIFKNQPKEITPWMKNLIETHRKDTGGIESRDLNVYFTGRTVPGNSGGPLVDSLGRVIGVCSGPRGTLGKEDSVERFIDFRPILRDVVHATPKAEV